MILTERYKEAMNRIAVTEDMRSRILNNIKNLDFPTRKAKSHPLPVRYMTMVAYFALFIVGTIGPPNFLGSLPSKDPTYVQSGVLERTEVSSLSELSQAVGFQVDTLKNLPFDIEEIVYTVYGTEMAEIKYVGAIQSLVFCKAIGAADPSGDYSYPDTVILGFSHGSATLKGESGLYCLATWQDDTYSYSIRISDALSDIEWMHIFDSLG